jgi:hypothetical protein
MQRLVAHFPDGDSLTWTDEHLEVTGSLAKLHELDGLRGYDFLTPEGPTCLLSAYRLDAEHFMCACQRIGANSYEGDVPDLSRPEGVK